jgi:hypothetical protein
LNNIEHQEVQQGENLVARIDDLQDEEIIFVNGRAFVIQPATPSNVRRVLNQHFIRD